jgi:hypothetical protein
MRLVSLLQLSRTYAMAMLMRDIGAVHARHRHCATYAHAQLMPRSA